jgi:Na+-driven multidrug efflux pump
MVAVLVVNVGLNLMLVPILGIVGASLSSLVSYSIQAAIVVFLASRLSGQKALSLFVPGMAEVHLLVETLRRIAARAMTRRSGSGAGSI